jgi:FtsH-binding integral membrane protein
MRRALRSGSRRVLVLAVAWGVLFALLLGLRVVFQRTDASLPHSQAWLRIGSVALLVLLTMAAALGQRVPWVGTIVLRVEQAAVFVAITRLLGLGTQPDPGRAEQILIALLGVHAVGAIVVSDELSTGTPPWRTGLWGLALSFAALTLSVLAR